MVYFIKISHSSPAAVLAEPALAAGISLQPKEGDLINNPERGGKTLN